jgi:hypothetical protein
VGFDADCCNFGAHFVAPHHFAIIVRMVLSSNRILDECEDILAFVFDGSPLDPGFAIFLELCRRFGVKTNRILTFSGVGCGYVVTYPINAEAETREGARRFRDRLVGVQSVVSARVIVDGPFVCGKISEDHVLFATTDAALSAAVGPPDLRMVAADLREMACDRLSDCLFRDAQRLAFLELPVRLKSIGQCCFQGCESLSTAALDQCAELDEIGKWAFLACSSLDSVVLPVSTRQIKDGAWQSSGVSSFDITACSGATFGRNVLASSRLTDIRSGIRSCEMLVEIMPRLANGTCLQRFSTELLSASGNAPIYAEAARAACTALETTCSDGIKISWPRGGFHIWSDSRATESVTVAGEGDALAADARVIVTCDGLPAVVRGPFVRALDLRAAGGHCLRGMRLKDVVPTLEEIVLPGLIEEMDDLLCSSLFRLRVVVALHCRKLRKIGGRCFNTCVSMKKLLLPGSVTEIGGSAFAGSHLLRLDLSDCALTAAEVQGAVRLEQLRLPRTLRLCGFWASAALRSLVVGHLENDESKGSTCSGRGAVIYFRSRDARMPPSFRVCSEKAAIFAEVTAISGRFTRPSLGFGI